MAKSSCRVYVTSILLFLICLFTVSCLNVRVDYYIFSNIDECYNISNLAYAEAQIIRYEDTSDDKYLKNLTYKEFYAGTYKSKELNFEIFAYEFYDSESAKSYFKNVTGVNTEFDATFLGSKGMIYYSLVVIDGNCAYFVLAPRNQSEILNKSLGDIFSKKINN